MKTCTKSYTDIPFAHRAPLHDGHCKLIHGHNWSFVITFAARETDVNGFVMDFGKLLLLREELFVLFDHTLVLNEGDPIVEDIQKFLRAHNIGNVRLLPDCSCEGIAKFVFDLADSFVRKATGSRAHVQSVTVQEDSKNSATYGNDIDVEGQ